MGEHKETILEPRDKWRPIVLVLTFALMCATSVAALAIWRFDDTINKVEGITGEQRCRSETVNEAIAVILEQQRLITNGLARLSSEPGDEQVVEEYIHDAEEALKRSDEVTQELETVVEDCAAANGGE